MKKLIAACLLFCAGPLAAGQKIITFEPSLPPEARARAVESRGGRIVKEFRLIDGVLADFPDGLKAANIARAPGVASAEDDEEVYWLASEALADLEGAAGAAPAAPAPAVSTQAPVAPVYISTFGPEGKADHMSWGVAKMRAPQAWAAARGAGARVAVLDTGVDCVHPDLAGACLPGHNSLNPRLPPSDDGGHGTHVAAVIAGRLNWSGAVGMAPEASLLPVKVLNSSGTGKVSEVIDGIEWAVANRADIINMSLGSAKFYESQAKAVKAARDAGVTVICAAGNSGGAVAYPAAYDGALAVSAIDYGNQLAPFSCRGPEIDFAAPGVKIYSAFPGGSFRLLSGTSQAAPHVSGLAALAVGLGVKGPDAVEKALARASVNIGLPAYYEGYGVPVASRLVDQLLAAPAR